MFKLKTKVKVISSNDESNPVDSKYMGLTGVITKEGDGSTVEEMIRVQFLNGDCDAFWPEELEEI